MTLDLHRFQDRLRGFRLEVERHPLAAWRAWDRFRVPDEVPTPQRSSQRESIQALQWNKTLLCGGGNRAGKTAGLMAGTVALVLGSDHPDAEAFWLLNGCDPRLFPTGPAQGWMVALTSNASLQYHRRQVIALLPRTGPEHPLSEVRGQPWHGWNLDGKGEARVDICVPGHATPARIVFKSEDPGEDAAKGDKCRVILHDEEGPSSEFFDEAEKRLWDLDGWQILCNTPTRGKRWSYKRFEQRRPPRTWSGRLWAQDNPHVRKERMAEVREDDPMAAVRLRGEYVDETGSVFGAWDPSKHVVHGLAGLIPQDWSRWRAIDFGFRDPFCCLWLSEAKKRLLLGDGRVIEDGSILVYREWYHAELTLPQHAQAIREAEGWVPNGPGGWTRGPKTEKVSGGWADTEAPGLIASLNDDFGLATEGADRKREAGIELVQRLLVGDAAGPKLFVDGSCVHLIEQVPEAQYTDATRETLKRAEDHALDPLRYGCMGIVGSRSAAKSGEALKRGMSGLLRRFGG